MQTSVSEDRRLGSWAVLGPFAALAGALGIAVVGAVLTGSDGGLVVGGVEGASANSVAFLGRVSALFPLGFAFGAGMAASVNPCGFAMLPAYLGLYISDNKAEAEQAGLPSRVERASLVGLMVTAGFVLLFGAVGLPIAFGARSIVSVFPWVGLSIGVLLTVVAAYLLSGGKLYNNAAMRFSAKLGNPGRNSIRGYFTFGLAYGTASLSCTLPIFLAVVGGTSTSSSFLASVGQFLLYGFGMGSVILVLTLSMALFKGAVVRGLKHVLPYVSTASAVLLLVSGAFIVYYWLTIGGLLALIQGS